MAADYTVETCHDGRLYRVRPLTNACRDWLVNYSSTPSFGAAAWSGDALLVGSRRVGDVIAALLTAGFNGGTSAGSPLRK